MKIGGNTVTVRGYTILPKLFPLLISATKVIDVKAEAEFDMTLQSVENSEIGANGSYLNEEHGTIPTPCKVEITVQINMEQVDKFKQAGGDLSKSKALLGGIPFTVVQHAVENALWRDNRGRSHRGFSCLEMVKYAYLLRDRLSKHLNGYDDQPGIFDEKGFGMRCSKVQVIPKIPASIEQSMISAGSIEYDNAARQSEYEADVAAAKKFQEELGLTSEKAWDAALTSRLTRDEQIERLQVEGLGNPVGAFVYGDTQSTKSKGNKGGK